MNNTNYIKEVIFNNDIFETLEKRGFGDRLGLFVIFKLDETIPNEEHIKYRTAIVLSNLYELIGYRAFTYEEVAKFSEEGESWINVDEDYEVRIRHKYWSLKKCQQFRDHFEVLAKYNNFKVITI